MFPNCNHLARPVPTPPDVYTGRTFSACRPIVGVGDQHDVVQSVSIAISEVTICHKENSPHSDQVSNVVLNMCVTKVSCRLGPQKLKLSRSSRAGFRAKDATKPAGGPTMLLPVMLNLACGVIVLSKNQLKK